MAGLIACFQHWDKGGFCLEKTFQFAFSSLFGLVALTQLILILKADCYITCRIKTKHILYVLMILALVTNCIHCLINTRYWFDTETTAFNLYFLTIVFFFSTKLFSSMYGSSKKHIYALRVGYICFVLFYIGVFIIAVLFPDPDCEQIWLVTVRGIGVVLALVFVAIGYIHWNKESKKIVNFNHIQRPHIYNPIPQLRTWILFNLIAQTTNFTEAVVFASMPQIHCRFDPQVPKNEQINYLIAFIMIIVTFYFSIGSTLYIFWVPILVFKKKPSEFVRSRQESLETCLVGLELVSRRTSNSAE